MTLPLLLTLLAVFVAVVATVSAAAWWWLENTTPEQRRLRNLVLATPGVVGPRHSLVAENHDPVLARLTRLIPKSPKDMSRLQRRLTRAGYPAFRSAVIYALAEMLLPIVLGVSVFAVVGIRTGLIPALLVAALGYALPGL